MFRMLHHFDFDDRAARLRHGSGNSTRTRDSGNHSRRPARREGRERTGDEATRRREPDGFSEERVRILDAAREAKPPRRVSGSDSFPDPSEVGREDQDHPARQVGPTAALGAQFFARAQRGSGLPHPHADLTTKGIDS